jgi:CheY-like chemotaxis protein
MNQSEIPVVPMSTILIVDDSPSYLAALLDRLEQHGFLIVLAQTAAEGLMRAEFAQPDLILLDVVMPTSMASRPAAASRPARRPRTCR